MLKLELLPGRYAVARLGPTEAAPDWATGGAFSCVSRSRQELSVVCEEGRVPAGVQCERGWRALRVAGRLEFDATGVLASMAVPLAEAEVPIFAVSTFDTDYLLVKEADLDRAREVLEAVGHSIVSK